MPGTGSSARNASLAGLCRTSLNDDGQDRRFLDHRDRHRRVDRLHVRQLREVIEVERLVRLDVARDHSQHEVPLAHRGVAVEHLGPLADRLGEGGDRIAALRRQLHVREDGDVESQRGPVEQRDAALDDAGLLQCSGCGASRWSSTARCVKRLPRPTERPRAAASPGSCGRPCLYETETSLP